MHDYEIKLSPRKTWLVFHVDLGLVGEFSNFEDAERFITWN